MKNKGDQKKNNKMPTQSLTKLMLVAGKTAT